MKKLALGTSLTLLLLSALHVYWAAGGQWGLATVIPTVDGRPVFHPSAAASLIVASLLAAAATLTLAATGVFRSVAPRWFVQTGLLVLAVVFLARSIGDFHLIGFTKTVLDTDFARMDTILFSPLCVVLALSSAVLALRGEQ